MKDEIWFEFKKCLVVMAIHVAQSAFILYVARYTFHYSLDFVSVLGIVIWAHLLFSFNIKGIWGRKYE
jgi:hypothetical protein